MFSRSGMWRALILVMFVMVMLNSMNGSSQRPFYKKLKRLASRSAFKEIIFGKRESIHTVNHVMLWTQMRSGSSFTGDLLTVSPQVFYFEEPLKDNSVKGLNESVSFLKSIFECHFKNRTSFFNRFMNGPNRNDDKFKDLAKIFPYIKKDPEYVEALCKSARTIITRVVAREMGTALPLMDDPTLNPRVIHLVRDPRALLSSRRLFKDGFFEKFYVGGLGFSAAEKNASAVCTRYLQDLAARDIFLQRFPDRYMIVRYEDLALHTNDVLRRLYTFMQIPYTATIAKRVASDTFGIEGKEVKDHPYTLQKNSSAAAFAWRERFTFEEVRAIQDGCTDALEGYGYRIYTSEQEFKDPNILPTLHDV